MQTKAEKNVEFARALSDEIKESVDRLIGLFENPPEGKHPEFGDVL